MGVRFFFTKSRLTSTYCFVALKLWIMPLIITRTSLINVTVKRIFYAVSILLLFFFRVKVNFKFVIKKLIFKHFCFVLVLMKLVFLGSARRLVVALPKIIQWTLKGT